MLDIDDLRIRIGQTEVLKGISVQLDGGRATTVLGRNGAGKTTLIRGLAGLVPTRGTIRLEGEDISRLPAAERARRIGYVSQDFLGRAGGLTVHEMLLIAQSGGRRGWLVPRTDLRRAEEILALLGLEPLAERIIGEMSGGQRQMVALAAALVRKPRLLLLDEPTSALDLANQLRMLEAVADYTRAQTVVTLMVLHDLNLAARFSDRALLLAQGQILDDGTPAEVITTANLAKTYGVHCDVSHHAEGWPLVYAHHAL